MTAQLSVIDRTEQAAVLMDPLRLRLLEKLREPHSAAGLSRRLRLPRQKLNYHLRELEKHRLVELVEERRRGNCIERVLRATARTYVISPAALGGLAADPGATADRFSSAHLVNVAASTVREVGQLRRQAEQAGKKLATLTLEGVVRFASAAARHAFAEELAAHFTRLVAKYHDAKAPGGRAFRFFVAGHPASSTRPEKLS